MIRITFIILVLLALSNAQLFQSRKLPAGPVSRVSRGTENEFAMPDAAPVRTRPAPGRASENDVEEEDDDETPQMCPVALSSSFELIRAVNNYRLTHNLPAINISRSLMSTSCAHTRDIAASKHTINDDCGLHSWSSCCYPSDHSNPNCMHRKALQVTTALKWNLFNVASYELAYEWTGGSFSAVRALDMFVSNEAHRQFMLQQGTWTDFSWRSIGASVGKDTAYIWFAAVTDPNGDFDQFNVEGHVMELPGCTCGAPVEWRPAPTLSPAEQAEEDKKKSFAQLPMMYTIEQGPIDQLEASLRMPVAKNVTTEAPAAMPSTTSSSASESSIGIVAQNVTVKSSSAVNGTGSGASASAEGATLKVTDATVGGVSLSDFLKGLLQ